MEQSARRDRMLERDCEMTRALDTESWDGINQLPGASASTRSLMSRLKGDRLSRWDRANAAVGCPHCPQAGKSGGVSSHFFWACPAAAQLWTNLLTKWRAIWTEPHAPTLPTAKTSIFSLRLSAMPDKLWSLDEVARLPDPTPNATIATHAAVQAAWRQHVLATLHTLWRWRTDADSPGELWTSEHAVAFHDACLHRALTDVRWPRTPTSAATPHTAAAIAAIRGTGPLILPQCPPDLQALRGVQYLLFFDGGSRGNPGAGGSGSVIVRVAADKTGASVIWTAAMSYAAPSTTNNQAEYNGLVVGLRAAREHLWRPLEVVGDSMLIIRQMQQYRPPVNPVLRAKYATARRLAGEVGVQRWHHHPRATNKMADAAANLAMDRAASSQTHHPAERLEHTAIEALLAGDFVYWRQSAD